MKVHDLKPAEGSRKARKRVGRGIGGKGGKTAGRGTKGQKARGSIPISFEGGQLPVRTGTSSASVPSSAMATAFTADKSWELKDDMALVRNFLNSYLRRFDR